MSEATLEDELLKWADGNVEALTNWKAELQGAPHFIPNLQVLKEIACDNESWNELISAVSLGLRYRLRIWFQHNFPERIDTCTVDEFLNMIPPKIELNQYKMPKTETTLTHKHPFSPTEIIEWKEFESEARNFVWNVPQRVKKVALSPIHRSVVGELGVQSCFQFWVLDPFNQVFQQIEEKIEFIRSSSEDVCVGSPDFIYLITETLSSFFEMKTFYTLDNHLTDLKIQWPQNNPSIKNIVEQVMGYLNFNGLRYGSLSSYQNTWFLKREADKLYISKAISFDNANPTLYRCIAYFVSLVRLSPLELKVEPPLRRSTRIINQNLINESSLVSGDHLNDFALSRSSFDISASSSQNFGAADDLDLPASFSITKLTEFIGSGFCGKVFKWKDSGVTAAVKVCDAYNNREGVTALQNEANVYLKLKDIQGKLIPCLLFHGEAWGFYFLATTFIEGKHPNQIQEFEEDLNKVLDEVRKRNVIHGDVKASNVIITPNCDLFLIDFSHAKILPENDGDYSEMEMS